jgi:2-polyprenyl-3-methyl-5-hydroxy-6-metoxy-1,4-benzoquinol methylase
MSAPTASHLPGGNRFDDVRIDLLESFQRQEDWLATVERKPVRGSRLPETARLYRDGALAYTGLMEAVAGSAVMRWWLREFLDYWSNVIGGRPLTVFDFHQLLFHYRRRFQSMETLDWSSATEHVAHWTAPENLYQTFHFVRKYAFQPVRSRSLTRLLKPNARVLEYGCALAPMYRTWRRYGAHVPTTWVLADIPNFPFHYARHAYALEASVERFATIWPDRFDDPLAGVDGEFDTIVVQEVFEHLDRPRFVADYLLERLRSGGILIFDYVRSEARGLDTPSGLAERDDTLAFLGDRLEIIQGEPASGAIARKR